MRSFDDVELVIGRVSFALSGLSTVSLDDKAMSDIVRRWLDITFLNLIDVKRPNSRIMCSTINVVNGVASLPDDYWESFSDTLSDGSSIYLKGQNLSVAAFDGEYEIEYYSSLGLVDDNIVISGIALRMLLLTSGTLIADDVVLISQRTREWGRLILG